MSFSLTPELPLYSLTQWLRGQPRPIWWSMVTSFIQNIIIPTHSGPLSTSLLTGSCWVSVSVLHISCDKPLITVGMDGCPTKTFLIAETASYNAPCKATPCITFISEWCTDNCWEPVGFHFWYDSCFCGVVMFIRNLKVIFQTQGLQSHSHRFPNVEHALLPHVYCLLKKKKKNKNC